MYTIAQTNWQIAYTSLIVQKTKNYMLISVLYWSQFSSVCNSEVLLNSYVCYLIMFTFFGCITNCLKRRIQYVLQLHIGNVSFNVFTAHFIFSHFTSTLCLIADTLSQSSYRDWRKKFSIKILYFKDMYLTWLYPK